MVDWKTEESKRVIACFVLVILVTDKFWPFADFVNILVPVITVFLWGILIIAAYFCLYLSFKEKKNKISLVEDKEEAEKFYNILKNKCKGRKALMIIAPWGFGKTDFYEASLRPL